MGYCKVSSDLAGSDWCSHTLHVFKPTCTCTRAHWCDHTAFIDVRQCQRIWSGSEILSLCACLVSVFIQFFINFKDSDWLRGICASHFMPSFCVTCRICSPLNIISVNECSHNAVYVPSMQTTKYSVYSDHKV